MIVLRDINAVSGITSPEIRQLIQQRIAEITQGEPYSADVYGQFMLVEAGDALPDIEAAIGRPVIGNFEWVVEWPCCFEAVFVLSDDGVGIDLLIPKAAIDTELLAICETHATPA